jgi:SAM-dependent methyltransferase
MKKLIKKFIPGACVNYFNKLRRRVKLRQQSTYEVFTDIYRNNHWGSSESISGEGSMIEQTQTLIIELGKLFKEKRFSSILDIPCGDFNWMKKVDLENIDYIGADIVEDLIEKNKKKYHDRENIRFMVLNLIKDPLPKSDLIIVRDCLVHLSNKDVINAIKNIKSSGSKYLLTTTFTNLSLNSDILTGEWRPLNLLCAPFNLSNPLLVINENCTEGNGEYSDKSMALWEIESL